MKRAKDKIFVKQKHYKKSKTEVNEGLRKIQ